MWRRTTLTRLVARTPLCLRSAGRPAHQRSGRSNSSSKSTSSTPQAPSETLPTAAATTALKQPSPSPTEPATAKASSRVSAPTTASPSMDSPASPAADTTTRTSTMGGAPSPAQLTALVTTVEQLKEASRRTQHTLRNHDDALHVLQQRFTLMERQVGQLESTVESLRGRLGEVHRVVGEIVLGQRNTDLLIQQMERQQQQQQQQEQAIRHRKQTAADPASEEGQQMTSVERSESPPDSKTHADALPKTLTSSSATKSAGVPYKALAMTPASPAPAPASSALAQQVAMLEARVNELTQELFGADRLAALTADASNGKQHPQTSAPTTAADAVSTLSAVLTSSNLPAKRAALMRALRQRHGATLFTDATGTTRVSSQAVRLHNIPLNMGAAEVRELCVHHVCGDDDEGLVSCMVCRTPPGSMGGSDEKGRGSGAGGRARDAVRGPSPVYASQRGASAAAATADASVGKTLHDGAASLGTTSAPLPRGSGVAAIQPNTKSFEVVFVSSALAVRALTVLNGLQLRPTLHAEPLSLAVEPVVSADVLAALREAEAAHGV